MISSDVVSEGPNTNLLIGCGRIHGFCEPFDHLVFCWTSFSVLSYQGVETENLLDVFSDRVALSVAGCFSRICMTCIKLWVICVRGTVGLAHPRTAWRWAYNQSRCTANDGYDDDVRCKGDDGVDVENPSVAADSEGKRQAMIGAILIWHKGTSVNPRDSPPTFPPLIVSCIT